MIPPEKHPPCDRSPLLRSPVDGLYFSLSVRLDEYSEPAFLRYRKDCFVLSLATVSESNAEAIGWRRS